MFQNLDAKLADRALLELKIGTSSDEEIAIDAILRYRQRSDDDTLRAAAIAALNRLGEDRHAALRQVMWFRSS